MLTGILLTVTISIPTKADERIFTNDEKVKLEIVDGKVRVLDVNDEFTKEEIINSINDLSNEAILENEIAQYASPLFTIPMKTSASKPYSDSYISSEIQTVASGDTSYVDIGGFADAIWYGSNPYYATQIKRKDTFVSTAPSVKVSWGTSGMTVTLGTGKATIVNEDVNHSSVKPFNLREYFDIRLSGYIRYLDETNDSKFTFGTSTYNVTSSISKKINF